MTDHPINMPGELETLAAIQAGVCEAFGWRLPAPAEMQELIYDAIKAGVVSAFQLYDKQITDAIADGVREAFARNND